MRSFKKSVFFVILLVCSVFPVFAQNVNSQINSAISKKDSAAISEILAANKDTDSYPKIEAYVMKKAHELAKKKNLDFALAVTLAVMDNNIDNLEALDFYAEIDGKIKARDAEKEEEKKESLEEVEDAVAEKVESVKKEVNRRKNADLVMINDESGDAVYIDQDFNTHYSVISWLANFGIIDMTNYFGSCDPELKYGVSTEANVFYHGDYINAGADVFFSMGILNFVDSATKDYMYNLWAAGEIGFPRFSNLVYLNIGYFRTGLFSDKTDNFLPLPFSSPIFGVTVRDVHFGGINFDSSINYYYSHLWTENVTFAGDLVLNFFIPLVDISNADLGVNFGVRDFLFVLSEGVQNQLKISISIEVFSNE